MAEFNERIKNIERVRSLIREFYLYGFKTRNQYNQKSARSYDDERRRIESYLSDYIQSTSSDDGKMITLSVDSRIISHNPFYRVFKAKSFTDNDITLHFIIFDILYDETVKVPLQEIIDQIDNDYLSDFDNPLYFDESTIRKKLNEYIELGLLKSDKTGKKVLYYRNNSINYEPFMDAVAFFSEVLPCGFIGSSILDKQEEHNEHFLFKHHYMIQAIDSEVVLQLFDAMHQKKAIDVTTISKRKQQEHHLKMTPLTILNSVQNGRQILLAYRPDLGIISSVRIDHINNIKLLETDDCFDEYRQSVEEMRPNLWAFSLGSAGQKKEHIEFEIRADENESYIVERLKREGRFGVVEQIDENHWRFSADVLDSKELNPWVRTFICRLTRLNYSNRTVENDFKKDLQRMMSLYDMETEQSL